MNSHQQQTAPTQPGRIAEQPTKPCEVPTKEIKTTVAIIGGGPHGLAVLSALHERSLSTPQFQDDAAYALRVGFNSYELVGNVTVIDPGTEFCDLWNKRFCSLEITQLRSPLFAHPDPYDEKALLNFAIKAGRTDEITHEGAEVSRDSIVRSNLGLGYTLHGKPSQALFKDFCAHLARKHPHKWVSTKATAVEKDEETGKYRVACGNQQAVIADAVVIATGPQGEWNVPKPFRPLIGTPSIVHTAELFAEGCTLSEAILARTARLTQSHSSRVLVIGGGLTAVQAALAVVRAGVSVSMVSRGPLRARDYDVETDWLDRRHSNRLRFGFLSTPLEERLKFLREAVGGGSVPPRYLEELREAEATTGRLKLRIDAGIEDWTVDAAPLDSEDCSEQRLVLTVNGERYDMVVLATGVALNPGSTELFQQLRSRFPANFVGGFPELDASLRWSEDENIFVTGCNAGLQLGPGALNLMGAMRSGRLVSEEVRELMWEEVCSHRNKLGANLFSMLECDDCCSELDTDSGEDSDIEAGASSTP